MRRQTSLIKLDSNGRTKVNTDDANFFMSIQPAATGPKKVLVIDDNEVILKTTSMKLQSAGYEVFTALDASEGIAAVRKRKPDLVLLDIAFPPDMGGVAWDGFRIMEWLHRVDETKCIPIIIISGLVEENNRQRATASGAVAFLPKPVNFDEMLRLIRTTFDAEANKASSTV